MIRLIGVEVLRLRSRRAVLLLAVAAVVLTLLIGFGVMAAYDPDGYYAAEFDLREQAEDGSGIGVVALLLLLATLVGTTFVGHDWNTGSVTNQLLFESRRLRLWTAKAVAVVLVTLTASLVVTTGFWLLMALLADVRGFPAQPDGALLDALQHGWRGSAFAAAGALGGYALTMLTRSTVFTIGALFATAVLSVLLLAGVGPRDSGAINPAINAAAITQDGVTYYVRVPDDCFGSPARRLGGDPDRCDSQGERTLAEGLFYYGVLLLLVGAGSLGSFSRRDV